MARISLYLKNGTPGVVVRRRCLMTLQSDMFLSVGDLGEILISTHSLNFLEEALTHTVSFVPVESFRVAVFSHIHPVESTIGIQSHYNAILVTVKNIAVISPDIIWEIVCSLIIQVANLIVWEILSGRGHNVGFIVFNSVVVLVKAKLSILRVEPEGNISNAEVYIVMSEPVQQVQAMSRPRLTEA